ncbi:transmembrane protein 256-like isoform X2 [Varroa destructor]|nr:transmembrane protein 256-like isoform X2 [Varroa destructor]
MGLQKAYEIAMVNGDYEKFKESQSTTPTTIVKLDAGVVTSADPTQGKDILLPPRYALCPPTLFIRIAAFLGASAVTLGAYGAHVLKPSGGMATIFHAANLYHFLHTLLLFMVSFSRYPRL